MAIIGWIASVALVYYAIPLPMKSNGSAHVLEGLFAPADPASASRGVGSPIDITTMRPDCHRGPRNHGLSSALDRAELEGIVPASKNTRHQVQP